jgi:hypothetical protein
MSKRIALKDFVEVDSVDLSDFARSVKFISNHAQMDVSGFNALGANEYLTGPTTQQLDVEFFGSYGSGEVHQTLYPIHSGRTVVPVKWRPDQTNPVGVTNPELTGNVQLFNYEPGAARGAEDVFTVTFMAVDAAGLAFVTV